MNNQDLNSKSFTSSSVRGILKCGDGSCFGPKVISKDKEIHTHQLVGGLFFDEWKSHMIDYRRMIVREFFELMIIDDQVQPIKNHRWPVFHRYFKVY